ncbi:right-handed parallel beta-helix repeat-containing protein [Acinetobacter sp. YH12021]|uniref:right-handed parallel beta-helix repeat-containing protein n=1 Tax=Acinetobacter sp. YH12021 TaxID=2601040 RepID=UPI0015D42C37|nr:right-handed parallel beta-helix repeat-containing protein [Acinetobacter sp. YH12021]
MAVQEQTPLREYTANGVTTSFALGFDCDNQDHLIVLVDDIESVVGTWSLSSGAVVFNTAPENGKKITIQRNTPFSRTTDYQSYNNSFRPPAVNKDFDWIWLKLQELGVADWILSNRIDALKNYVDDRDDELRTYLLEEIRKQGVALDQLENYYNHLIQRLANAAMDGGFDTSLVAEGTTGFSQSQINAGLSSVAELLSIESPLKGMRFFVKSHHNEDAVASSEFLGNGWYVYDPKQANINNGGTVINGWVLIPENNTITPYHFGWTGRDLAADMEAFQKCFDAVKNGQTIRFWHTSRLEKQVGKHTDIYGTEGRSLGRLTLNGGQPCLIMRAKKNVTVILDSAELFTETACQGLLDLYKCHRCKVISGTLTGGNYIRETGEYQFPPIDGTTGRAEKGYSDSGFNTTTLSPDIGGMSNNMVITQNETSGGYGGQFPQFDGTTAPTWGVWRGGQLGNHSEGIRVIGGFGNEILGTEIHGFNGSAIRLGLLRSLDGKVDYPRISNPESRAITAKGTKIRGTYLHNCYIGGCQSDRSIDTYFNDYNIVEDMGHPDASIAHEYVDPGYGFSTSRAMPNFKIHINHNAFTNCFRKGIDCHQGSQLHIEKNSIKGTMFHGIGIAVDDDFADTFYQPYFEHVGIIKDNEIESHDVGIFYANGQFGRGRRETAKKRWERLHVNITGNVIRSTSPFFYNFAHSPFYIANNTFIFAAPYAYQKAVVGNKCGVYIGSFANRGFTSGDVISHNKFLNSKDGNFAYGVFVENGSKQTKAIKITENHFDISRWYQKDGADSMYVHNDVVYRSGFSTAPIQFGGNNIPQDVVVENNTVWDDFNHELVALYAGGGSGLIAYPLIDGHGRVTGIQVFDGGSGYSPSTVFVLRAKGRSAGATLNATIVDGVVTGIQVTNAGRFYRSSYGLTIPRGLVSYDMRHVSGSSCYDKGIGSSTDTGCVLSVVRTDMTPPITPFSIESGVRWMNTTKEGQYAIHSGGVRGGTLSFWIEVSSTTSAGGRALALPVDSLDESSNAAAAILANVSTTGFTVSGVYVDNELSTGQTLSFDTPYLITLSSAELSGASILFGSNADFTGAFLDAKYAFIELHRGYTYSANEVSDLFEMRRSMFGK